MKTDENIEKEENFESMLEESMRRIDYFEPGQQIESEIVSISSNTIFLQLSGKSEGVLDLEEMTDKDGNLTVKEGDIIKVFFLEAKNGEMRFTTRIRGDKAQKSVIENAFNNGIPVEGLVEKEIKGGFEIKIGESRAFCPFSQMGLKRVENAAEYIGKNLTFKIIEYKEGGRNILVSSRAVLEEKRKEQVESLKTSLHEGMTVPAVVKSLRDFGAFVEVGGIQALLPISEISRNRIDDISEALSVGQEVEVEILKIDWSSERISVSMKALEADPWDTAAEKYRPGSKHDGKIVRIADFGLFVSLEPGLDGLIHISDLKVDERDSKPLKSFKKGQPIAVIINSLDLDRKRISLKTAAQTNKEMDKYISLDSDSGSDTYNPFAALLKDKR